MARNHASAPNFIERAIAAISPGWAYNRHKSRSMLALTGGYHGGRRDRPALREFTPRIQDADGDMLQDLETLRARTRDLARNSPIGGGAINAAVTNVVGTGLSFQSKIDREYLGLSEEEAEAWQNTANREVLLWMESTNCDVTGAQNFYGLQDLAFRSSLESGDCFGIIVSKKRSAWPFTTAIQIVEADRCSNPNYKPDTDTLHSGIETDKDGEAIRYHFSRRHPGAMRQQDNKWDAVPARGGKTGARKVLHLFEKRRPGQMRGIPFLAPVIEPLKQLERYTEAELQAAVISGAFAVFAKMDSAAFDQLFGDNRDALGQLIAGRNGWDGSMPSSTLDGPGKAINLLPGEEIDTVNPGRPNSEFDPFVVAIVKQIGVALEMPFEVLMKYFTSSYTAARAALLDAWRFFNKRRDWLATYFCQPCIEAVIEEAVLAGRIVAPGFFDDPMVRRAYCAGLWIGDAAGQIDPTKEITAAKDRIESTLSNHEIEAMALHGKNWRMVNSTLGREVQIRRETGTLDFKVSGTAQPATAAPPVKTPDQELGSDLET